MKIEAQMCVNTKDIDRLAIGARLYDMLDLRNKHNKFKISGPGLYIINESVIEEMLKLVNPDMAKYVKGNGIEYPRSK